jgi:hypothetical protein
MLMTVDRYNVCEQRSKKDRVSNAEEDWGNQDEEGKEGRQRKKTGNTNSSSSGC